jgi:hypothetical protein
LSVVARTGGQFAVAHGPKLPAERLLGDRDAEFLEDPLRQIDQSPAHHTMHCGDRATFDHAGDGLALGVIELGWVTRRLAIHQTIRTSRVEAQDPVADDLKADPADLRCLRARRSIIDGRKSKKSTGLWAILRPSRQDTKLRRTKIPA